MDKIINFRPSSDAKNIIQRLKDEGTNISAFLNNLIVSNNGKQGNQFTEILCYPEANAMSEMDARLATPVSNLNVRRYKEFLDVLASEGMRYHYFNIDADHSIGLIAVNREEASIQFAQYYTRDSATKEYARTLLPLPHVRYNTQLKTAYVIINRYQ